MKHPDPIEISKYIDNELAAGMVSKIEKHLSECGECRNLHTEFKNIKSRIEFTEYEVPDLLFAKISSSVNSEKKISFGFAGKLAFGLTVILFFAFSFAFSLMQGKSHFENRTLSSDDQIADEFIANISSYPHGSLLSTVSQIDR